MRTQAQHILMVCLSVLWPICGDAAPFRLTPEGATGNPNDGLGMPLSEMRKQLDEYWTTGEINKFYIGGQMLCSALRRRATLIDEASAQDYVATCIYILSHANTTPKYPYGTYLLVAKKGTIGPFLISGDYLHIIPDGEYQKVRLAVLDAAMKLMDELRNELMAEPPVVPERTPERNKPGLEGEELARVIKVLREQERLMLAANTAISAREEIPKLLRELEAKFVAFAEQEYRRVPPEKGEIENIIAHAGLPKDGSERLRLLIPR